MAINTRNTIDYYIIYLGDGLPAFNEVRLNYEKLLEKNINTETKVTIHSHDNFVESTRQVDISSDFVWSSPEIEEIWVNIHDSNRKIINTISIDCDKLSSHLDIEDYIQEKIGMLNTNQLNYIGMPGCFFWHISSMVDMESKSLSAIAIQNLVFIIAKLLKGIILCFEEGWNLKILPMNAERFLQQ